MHAAEKHTCCERVYSREAWGHGHLCGRTATLEHNGQWYCKTHHPPTIQAKREVRTARRETQWAKDRKAWALQKAAPALLESLQVMIGALGLQRTDAELIADYGALGLDAINRAKKAIREATGGKA